MSIATNELPERRSISILKKDYWAIGKAHSAQSIIDDVSMSASGESHSFVEETFARRLPSRKNRKKRRLMTKSIVSEYVRHHHWIICSSPVYLQRRVRWWNSAGSLSWSLFSSIRIPFELWLHARLFSVLFPGFIYTHTHTHTSWSMKYIIIITPLSVKTTLMRFLEKGESGEEHQTDLLRQLSSPLNTFYSTHHSVVIFILFPRSAIFLLLVSRCRSSFFSSFLVENYASFI